MTTSITLFALVDAAVLAGSLIAVKHYTKIHPELTEPLEPIDARLERTGTVFDNFLELMAIVKPAEEYELGLKAIEVTAINAIEEA